jgi:hypothetical protein
MREPPATASKTIRRRQVRAAIGNRRLGLIVLILTAATLAFAAFRIAEAVRNGWCWACG